MLAALYFFIALLLDFLGRQPAAMIRVGRDGRAGVGSRQSGYCLLTSFVKCIIVDKTIF